MCKNSHRMAQKKMIFFQCLCLVMNGKTKTINELVLLAGIACKASLIFAIESHLGPKPTKTPELTCYFIMINMGTVFIWSKPHIHLPASLNTH